MIAKLLADHSWYRSASVAVVLCVTGVGCQVKPPSPPVSFALYDPQKTMVYNSTAQSYSIHFDGVYSWSYPNGCQNVPFSFTNHASQAAQLVVSITDTAGLQPGDQFIYNLVFVSPNGDTLETFTLPLANPISSGIPRINLFPPFYIQLNSTIAGLNWQVAGQPVVGSYSIVGARAMTIGLQFLLGQTVAGAAGPACSPPT